MGGASGRGGGDGGAGSWGVGEGTEQRASVTNVLLTCDSSQSRKQQKLQAPQVQTNGSVRE